MGIAYSVLVNVTFSSRLVNVFPTSDNSNQSSRDCSLRSSGSFEYAPSQRSSTCRERERDGKAPSRLILDQEPSFNHGGTVLHEQDRTQTPPKW